MQDDYTYPPDHFVDQLVGDRFVVDYVDGDYVVFDSFRPTKRTEYYATSEKDACDTADAWNALTAKDRSAVE